MVKNIVTVGHVEQMMLRIRPKCPTTVGLSVKEFVLPSSETNGKIQANGGYNSPFLA